MSLLIALGLIVLVILGAPLFTAIGASAMLGFAGQGTDLSIVAIEFYGLAGTPVLLAIPLFTFAGFLLSRGGAPSRLVNLSQALLGWLPGGLAMVSLAACALFTAFTGASGVTIIALGAVLFPALVASGYSERFSLGLITTSGSLGLLFAPSLPLILYGVVSEVPVQDLFIAGILPGLLMVFGRAAYSLWVCRGVQDRQPETAPGEAWAAVKAAAWDIPLPIVVLGGIYGGWFAISEAAAVTALYVLIVETMILREIRWRELPRILRESMTLVGGILIILGLSLASTNYMIDAGVPQALLEWVSGWVDGRLSFLLLLLVFLLVLGAILDIFSALVLMVPLLLPVAAGFDIHPVHLGIIFLAVMELGYVTPPVGLNLFMASYRFDKSIVEVYRSTLPFFFVMLVTAVIIAFWPWLSLVLLGEA